MTNCWVIVNDKLRRNWHWHILRY